MIFETKIADVPVRFSGDLNEAFISRVSPYQYKIKENEDCITINYSSLRKVTLPKNRKTIKIISDREIFYDGEKRYCFADFNVQIQKYISKTSVLNDVADIEMYDFHNKEEIEIVSEALREYKKTMPNPKERLEAEDVYFDQNMPLINSTDRAIRFPLLLKNVLAIHSSAISYKNSGLIFSAPSGTGKSTHTALWQKCFNKDVTLINDDSPFISINENNIVLHGSPWAGASGLNENKSVPLKAIVFLEQAKENSIEKLPTIFALRYLLKQINVPFDKTMTDKVYTLLNLLLSSVNCYLLKCLPNEDAVMTVKKAVLDNE